MKRISVIFLFLLGVGLFVPAIAHAQNPDPNSLVISDLVGHGFDVIKVANFPDANGNPDKNSVYVELETITNKFDNEYLAEQVASGIDALAKYYPNVENYIVVLHYDHWLFFFVTNAQDWDDVVSKRVRYADWWEDVRSQVRIFDITQNKYITSKDFTTQNQTNKNQTNKDFSGLKNAPTPPTSTDPNIKAENILVEPSSTFLPADGHTQDIILATLSDANAAGLPGRGVNFTYEVQGQDPKNLPAAQTDQYGTARTKIASSRELDEVLINANTSTLNASARILVGAPPGDNTDAQAQAVIDGLNSQGYTDVDAEYDEESDVVGQTHKSGFAVARLTEKTFDRVVYSQLFRMMGTIRTVMPEATTIYPILLYAAPDGHDYQLVFRMRTDVWDAYLNGNIGENQMWANLDLVNAVNEKGVSVNEKDFLSKNFSGSDQTNYANVPGQVVSTLTTEAWGEQLHIGSFLVPVGASVDSFKISELSGSATGFTIFESPDYNTPVFTFTKGNDAALGSLVLGPGQYVVNVDAPSAPAKLTLQYVEHIAH